MDGHSPTPGYDAADLARFASEVGKDPSRPAFTRDRARVLHSWALRRLADKTQVLLPGRSDFPRTRLTHTLEVAQIAREIGAELGCDPDLTETAGLCHDLGHPPFGHNGESALNEIAVDIGGFEGNAQSFRVLTRLEPKVITADGTSAGLNLTRAALDSVIKYPWFRTVGHAKFNVYADDAEVFEWVRAEAPGPRRCLEAQVMDWADDVAYSVHDIEDALYSGYLTPQTLTSEAAAAHVIDVAASEYAGHLSEMELGQALERLNALTFRPKSFTGSMADLAGLKAMTSGLIGRFSQAAVAATREPSGTQRLLRYRADLCVPTEVRAEVAVLKSFAFYYVFHRRGVEQEYAAQRQLLTETVEMLMAQGDAALHPTFAEAFREADGDDAARLRVVVDQSASLTDVSVVRWHARLRNPPT